MKIITKLVILTLSLLPVNAGEHCDYLLMKYNQFKTECNPGRIAIRSCCDLIGFPISKAPDDVYQMKKCRPDCEDTTPFTTVNTNVYCNMHNDGGGWTVIQRNKVDDSSVDFNKKWSDYEEGFGNLETTFWYGLKSIHCLTQNYPWEMSITVQFKNGHWRDLRYNQFSVGSASEEYPLTIGGYTGEDPDYFATHQLNGMKFSTLDNDNDNNKGNCAVYWKSGWWYNNCTNINLNKQPPYIGNRSVLYTDMKIRPKDCIAY